MRIGDEIWLGFDAESGEFLGASPDKDKDEMRYICESGVVQWALYVAPPPAQPPGNPNDLSYGDAKVLLASIKAALKQEADMTSGLDSRVKASQWLSSWFDIIKKPARKIEAYWSDEPIPEPK